VLRLRGNLKYISENITKYREDATDLRGNPKRKL
jgi:hypothetical protein